MKSNTTKPWHLPNQHCRQLWKIMRITTVLLIVSIMQVSAVSFGQKVTLNQTQMPLANVFIEISKQTGYDFWVNSSMLKNTRPVSIQVKDADLTVVLHQIFKDQPLTYTIRDKVVTVKVKEASILEKVIARFQSLDIGGRVLTTTGQPLVGASVKLKGKNSSVTTNNNGFFTLRNVQEGEILVVSYIGYATRELVVKDGMGDIVLEVSDSKLDEIQVIAYGTTTKRLSTGSVGSIKADVIERQPVSNPLLALSGRIAGLDVTQLGGVSGSGVRIRIRGQNSLRAEANNPLYIIDGVPFTSQSMKPSLYGQPIFPADGNIIGSSAASPFNALNPGDIESVEVLKDADATAIYGSRGANGVILITTKKGKAGKTRFDIDLSSGAGSVVNYAKLLDRRQYLDMRYEAFRNDGLDFNDPSVVAPDLTQWDTTRTTDWQKELMGGSARFTNMQTAISGGSERTQFMVGGGYIRESSVFPGDFANNKFSGRFSINHRSEDNKLNATFTTLYSTEINKLPSFDPTGDALTLPPVAPPLYDEKGNLNWAGSSWYNPLSSIKQDYEGTTNNASYSTFLSYRLFAPFSLKLNAGYNRVQFDSKIISPYSAKDPMLTDPTSQWARGVGTAANANETWNIEPQLQWTSSIGPGNLDVLLGSTFQRTSQYNRYLDLSGFSDDALLNSPAAATIASPSGVSSIYLYNSLFARINYNIANKYILNLTGRRDGSSRFGPGKQFGNFGAAGAAWVFSEERFLKSFIPYITFGKLRASYGVTGSDAIPDYGYLSNFTSKDDYGYSTNTYGGVTILRPTNLSNDAFGWETNRKMDVALELGLGKDVVFLNVNYFRNRSSNQLVGYVLPAITGFPTVQMNLPATVQNAGWEFELNLRALTARAFTWRVGANLTIPRNKLVDYPDLGTSGYRYDYEVGYPLNIFKIFDMIGTDPQTGINRYLDSQGNITNAMFTLPDAERLVIMNLDKKLYGGINNSFQYKNFGLDVFFQFAKQQGRLNRNQMPGFAYNYWLYQYEERWTTVGQVTNSPKLTQSYGDVYQSLPFGYDRYSYGDASYVRLKNVLLSYNLADKLARAIKVSQLRLFVSGQNLFTITNYKGLDPETMANSLPPLRVITGGIKLTL